MRIFLHDNIFCHAKQRGIARYFRHTTDGIITYFGSNVTIFSSNVRDYGPAKQVRALSLCFRGSERLGIDKLNDTLATWTAHRMRPTVVFSSYYGSIQTNAAKVFCVYDMIHELFLQHTVNHPSVSRHIAIKDQCLESADMLFAISDSTARDVLSYYPQLDPNKIVVTRLGVDPLFFDAILSSHRQKPYFLYVGHRDLYKNFRRLLLAFGQSGLATSVDLCVISPGLTTFSVEEREYIRRYQLDGSIHLLSAQDDTLLRDTYASAVALVYPSEYEGFGLPLLEAFASGTVVATSNTSSMPEVGGDVAFYFDPYSPESIADCLRHIIELSDEERSGRISRGIARARTFTWERCQDETVMAIRCLV